MNRIRGSNPAATRRSWLAAAAVWGSMGSMGLMACSNTQIRQSWSLSANAREPLTRLLVIGVSRLAAPRRAFEDAYVAELEAAGVGAMASYKLSAVDGPQDPEEIRRAVKVARADGITVSHYLGEEKTIVRSSVLTERVDLGRPHGFITGYSNAWVRVYEPVETEVVRAIGQTSVYRASDGELVWSAVTEASRPSDVRAATRSFAKLAIADMKQHRVI